MSSLNDQLNRMTREEILAQNAILTRRVIKKYLMFFGLKWAVLIGIGILGRKLARSLPDDK